MQISNEVTFSQAEISDMIDRAVDRWTGGARPTCSWAQVTGIAATLTFCKRFEDMEPLAVILNHPLMVSLLVSSAAAAGKAIDPASCRFGLVPARAGCGRELTARANLSDTTCTLAPTVDRQFPMPAEVLLHTRQIARLVRKAVERTAGNTVCDVLILENDNGAYAKVTVSGAGEDSTTMLLSDPELVKIVAEELTILGYAVKGDDVSLECAGASWWDRGFIVRAHVLMTSVPLGKL